MERTTPSSAVTTGRSAAPVIVTMWKYTRLIVLTAVCAALYAVALNILQTPPPLSTYFVGELLPQPLSHLFGPAAAFGLSIGQLVSAFISGQLQIGNLFGMLDNFLLGFLPFMMWTRLRPLATGSREASLTNPRNVALFVVIAWVSSCAAAITISFPMAALGLVPYRLLLTIIGIQDGIAGTVSGLLLLLIYPRIRALGLIWWQIMDSDDLDSPRRRMGVIGAWLVVVATALAWIAEFTVAPGLLPISGAATAAIVAGAVLMMA